MKKTKYILLTIGILGFLISWKQTINAQIEQAEFRNNKHNVSIEGLWRCTQETAYQYPHGTLEYIMKINSDSLGKLTARGCFLFNDRFFDYWEFDSIQFIDSTNQLVVIDNEGGTYKGIVDPTKENIQGFAAWEPEDTTDIIQLDFIRGEETDENKFFIPYPPEPDGKIKYTYHQPEQIDEYLNSASIFDFIKDSILFYSLMERIIKQEFGRLESFLIIKDQKLVLEEYFYGHNRTQLHYINSCTKSVVSMLLGITLERHEKNNVDQPVFDFFPQYDSLKTEKKKQITLEHVLTMTSGFQEEDDFEIRDPEDQVKQILSLPLESTPGKKFRYNNNCTNLLGGIINALEKKQADEFAKEVLFNKLGISEFYWEKENGVLLCQSGLHMYPRDMSKIGLLALNNGYWNGDQIVPKEWILTSTKAHVSESKFSDYGYQWWYRSKQNKSWWKNPVHGSKDEHDIFTALGFGGQYIQLGNVAP